MENTFKKYKVLFLVALIWATAIISKILIPLILATLELENELSAYLKIFIVQIFAFLIPLAIFLHTTIIRKNIGFEKEPLYELGKLKSSGKLKHLNIIGLTVIFYIFIKFFMEAFINLYVYFGNEYSVSTSSIPTFSLFVVLIFVYAFIPAIIEETIYRGIYFVTFEKNKYLLFIVPTIVFAFAHLEVLSMITSTILGLYLMFIMYKTRDLKLLMILHFVYNSISLIFSNYIKMPLFASTITNQAVYQIDQLLGASLICFGIAFIFSVLIFFYYLYINKNVFEKDITEKYSFEKPNMTELVFSLILILSAIVISLFNYL